MGGNPLKMSLLRLAAYGFIPASRTDGGRIFLPGITFLWHIGAGQVVNRKRMQIFYSGSVQGVGFRYAVKSVATGFEVAGTVRNLPDGRVELVVEGAKSELESFRQAIRDAGLEHFIRDESVQWGEAEHGFRGFEIIR
jgi:acylphosphatase